MGDLGPIPSHFNESLWPGRGKAYAQAWVPKSLFEAQNISSLAPAKTVLKPLHLSLAFFRGERVGREPNAVIWDSK